MNDGRHCPIVGYLQLGVDAQRTLLQRPIGPHGDVFTNLASGGVSNPDLHRQFKHRPQVAHPGARSHDAVVAANRAPVGLDSSNCLRIVTDKAGDTDAGQNANPQRFHFAGESDHCAGVISVAARFLVKYRGNTFGAPVRKKALHVAGAVLCTLYESRVITNGLLLLINAGDVFMHRFTANLHIADGMIAVGIGVAFPYFHGVGHELPHGGLVVVVSYYPTGDSCGAGTDTRFIHDQNVLPGSCAAIGELLSQMKSGA